MLVGESKRSSSHECPSCELPVLVVQRNPYNPPQLGVPDLWWISEVGRLSRFYKCMTVSVAHEAAARCIKGNR